MSHAIKGKHGYRCRCSDCQEIRKLDAHKDSLIGQMLDKGQWIDRHGKKLTAIIDEIRETSRKINQVKITRDLRK